LVKPQLLDLFCITGQPDRALDLWTASASADQVLADSPGTLASAGTAAIRQGRVFALLGNYASGISIWTKEAIPQIRVQRTLQAPFATRAQIDGNPLSATRTFLDLPAEVGKQAFLEFEVGMMCLESGQPLDTTAEHLTNVLKLQPDIASRPVIAYYLEKLGKPVPPPSASGASAAPVGTLLNSPPALTPAPATGTVPTTGAAAPPTSATPTPGQTPSTSGAAPAATPGAQAASKPAATPPATAPGGEKPK
jgi:hypothetical protein